MEKKRSCPSQAALEEYAVAFRIGAPDPAVAAHLKACAHCREIARKLESESDRFLDILRSAPSAPASECPDHTLLAAYLDKALDPGQRNKIEQHLALCRPCQQKMISIYRETDASGAREAEAGYGAEPVVLAEQKRVERTSVPAPPPPRLVGDTADAEPRKKRLSSDFD
jgi:anti-sigma factor RsiW